jgi:hypothetical protein
MKMQGCLIFETNKKWRPFSWNSLAAPTTQDGSHAIHAGLPAALTVRVEMAESFEELITEVCNLIGVQEPQRLINGESIVLDDVMFSIANHPSIDVYRIYIFVTFGQLPVENRVRVLEEMLKENHSFKGKGPGFTISPATGNVVYALHVFLDQTEAVELVNIFGCLAKSALKWRETFLLDQSARRAGPGSHRPHFIRSAP